MARYTTILFLHVPVGDDIQYLNYCEHVRIQRSRLDGDEVAGGGRR